MKTATFFRGAIVLLASVGPAAFPLAQAGYAPLHRLAAILILPSALLLLGAAAMLPRCGFGDVGGKLRSGLIAGAVATLGLEAVRYTGFRLGFMPGNLPELMGVLLLDRFALGPSTASTLAGFGYHFYNGAAFGAIFSVLAAGRSRWWALPYGLFIGIGFLASPVVQSLGIGLFGMDFGWHFAATVLTAHAAFGAVLAAVLAVRRRGKAARFRLPYEKQGLLRRSRRSEGGGFRLFGNDDIEALKFIRKAQELGAVLEEISRAARTRGADHED